MIMRNKRIKSKARVNEEYRKKRKNRKRKRRIKW